jgi:hypothetical protein
MADIDLGPYASWHQNTDGGPWLKDAVSQGGGIFFYGPADVPFGSIYGYPAENNPVQYQATAQGSSGVILNITRLEENNQDYGPLHVHWGVPTLTKDGPLNGTSHCNISALVQLDVLPGSVPFSITLTIHRLFSSMSMNMNEAPLGPDDQYNVQLVNRADFFTFVWDGMGCSVWQGAGYAEAGGIKLFDGNVYLIHGEITSVPEGAVQTNVPSYGFVEWMLSFWQGGASEITEGPAQATLTVSNFSYNLYCGDPTPGGGIE